MKEFRKLNALVNRNIKVYFKDKTLFFVSLITPIILVVLFLTFLGKAYTDTLLQFVPAGITLSDRLINGFTGGWLFSSILATSCITVAFCSNVMVNDKINHTVDDFNITPVKKSTINLSYFLANLLTTLIICYATFAIGMVYLAVMGWYLSLLDILSLILVIFLNTLLGTLLAAIVEMFINTQGALSGVCTLVSSMYGFLCGAYMPIAQFSEGIRLFVGFLPGTYATVLFRHFFMHGAVENMRGVLPDEAIDQIYSNFDGKMVMFGHEVPIWLMFLIVVLAIVLLLIIYILLSYRKCFTRKNKLKGVH